MKNNNKILIVDDQKSFLRIMEQGLVKYGFNVISANSGKECLELAKKHKPGVILLDVMMPKMNGFETCRELKHYKKTKDIPVIIVTGQDNENNVLEGFDCGADDYVTKPFSIKILIARIKAVLKRTRRHIVDLIIIGDITIDVSKREVLLKDKPVDLTYSQFEIMLLFVNNLETVFSRKQIVQAIRGDNYPVTERAVDVHIVELRKLLKDYGTCIKTVRGVGYKLSIAHLNFNILD